MFSLRMRATGGAVLSLNVPHTRVNANTYVYNPLFSPMFSYSVPQSLVAATAVCLFPSLL